MLEPHARRSDPIALVSVIAGVAPLPCMVLGIVPFVGCLTTPFIVLAVPSAIGFGIAGLVRARKDPEPNYVQPLTGLVLGLLWLSLMVAGAVLYLRGDFVRLMDDAIHSAPHF